MPGSRLRESMKFRVWLQDFGSKEVKELIEKGNDIILIPVGSLEQHGSHLPLGTDSFVVLDLQKMQLRDQM